MMYRLPKVPGEWIDRSRTLEFRFEGRKFQGFAGDTLSAALAAAGEMTLGRSFKYHRPRGIFSFANHDANNLFQVGEVPNVRGDVTPLLAGAEVYAVNTVGGVRHDRARFLEWLAPFMPVGWYYKAFHGKNFRRWEHCIRKASGLGRIDADAPRVRTPKRYAFCDVLVIGAGASGLATALSAADAGARVLLVDENAHAGGSAPWTGAVAGEVDSLVRRVTGNPNIELLTATYAAGVYADRWVALVEPSRMAKVRAGAIVFATGAIEQPAVFRNNDLPGVLLGSAAQRLLRRYAIAPGKRVTILTANREGYELARELRAHQVEVAAVLDLRAGFGGDAHGLGDLRCVAGVTPEAAVAGRHGAVRALRVRVNEDESRPMLAETIACDAVIMSVGFAPASGLLSQAGALMHYDMALQQHVPDRLPPGIFAAGRVNGIYDYAARRQDGRDAGAEAAAFARGGHVGSRVSRPDSVRQVSHPYPVFTHPAARDFVDLDEDIQVKDLLDSASQGFDST
ncbi:MAG TPA: 2Fe-2S iron-sulfur cluster-binding protein, partial [Steroidobacteraceae bacterium]